MSTRMTRQGWAVIVGGSILAGLGAGMATGDVCYWGRCSDRIPSPNVARASDRPVIAADRAEASALFGPIALPTPPATPVLGPVARTSRARTRPATPVCTDDLAQVLYRAGFRGTDLREAWAIVMRESNGRNLGPGDPAFNGADYGLFQFNKPTWSDAPWWDDNALLDPDYNARVAYRLSDGGRTWAHWGLTGSGETDASLYGMWSDAQVWAWITEPYQRYYRQYPC